MAPIKIILDQMKSDGAHEWYFFFFKNRKDVATYSFKVQ
jgi:hypothetical protein